MFELSRPSNHRFVKSLLILILLGGPSVSRATDVYDSATGVLTIPSVIVGNTTYLNVVVTIGNVISVGGSLPATVSVPLLTAVQNNIMSGYSKSFTINGYYDTAATPITGSGSINIGGATPTSLNGVQYLKQIGALSLSLTVNGTTTPLSSVATRYINPTTFATAIVDETNPYYVFPAYKIPGAVVEGQTGIFGTTTEYSSSSKSTIRGTVVSSYAVTSDSNTSLLVTTISDDYDTSNNHTAQTSVAYRVTTSGTMTPLSETVVSFSVNGSKPFSYTLLIQ